MLCRSGHLDKEDFEGGGLCSVYVLTIPRTREETVYDSYTVEEREIEGERGYIVMRECVFRILFQLVMTESDRLLHSLAFFSRHAEHTFYVSNSNTGQPDLVL